jgi:hypothetical protein
MPLIEDHSILFETLANQWKRETAHLSSAEEMCMNFAYQQIVGMGKSALPMIFEDLKRGPEHWFWALRAITRENPVADEKAGDVPAMSQAWIEWGRAHGHTE